MISRFTICRDEKLYLAFPDVALTPGGRLVAVFAECTHHADRGYTRIVLSRSDDRGRTWTPRRPLTEATHGEAFYNCPRVTQLADGRLAVICDRLEGLPDGSHASMRDRRNLLWFSPDGGETWGEPVRTPMDGIVPDRLVELPGGRWIISSALKDADDGRLYARLWRSDDGGATWRGPSLLARKEGLNLCEGTVLALDDETLVAFFRENSGKGWDAYKVVSRDGGETWTEPVAFPLPGCHRPVAGMLLDGRILITHRFMQGGKGWTGWWTQNLFAALTDVGSALAPSRGEAHTRIMPVDFDRSPESDTGYSGWVQFPDGEIYIVNYIVDDWPRGQIRGYALRPEDFVLPGG